MYYHTPFQYSKQSGTSVTTTLQVCVSAMLLLIVEIKIQQQNIHESGLLFQKLKGRNRDIMGIL
jgi:hypothetical protein